MFVSWLSFILRVLSFPVFPLKKEKYCVNTVCVYIRTDTYIHVHPNAENQNICSFHKPSSLFVVPEYNYFKWLWHV